MNNTKFSLVLTSFLVVLYWSCARAEEVTHMPDVEDLTLAPNILKIMQNAEVLPSEECTENMNDYLSDGMAYFDEAVQKSKEEGFDGVPFKNMTPCSLCRIVNEDFKLVKIENLIVYRYLNRSYILDAYLRFPKIHLECDNCVLTDNGGKQHRGDFDIIWTEPHLNVLAEDVHEISGLKRSWLKFDKFNATNLNRNTINGTCKGDDEKFKEVCKQSHESGELDHVMHAASERLFKLDKKDLPFSSMLVSLSAFGEVVSNAFRCSMEA